MAKKRYRPEEIISKLREADTLIGQSTQRVGTVELSATQSGL